MKNSTQLLMGREDFNKWKLYSKKGLLVDGISIKLVVWELCIAHLIREKSWLWRLNTKNRICWNQKDTQLLLEELKCPVESRHESLTSNLDSMEQLHWGLSCYIQISGVGFECGFGFDVVGLDSKMCIWKVPGPIMWTMVSLGITLNHATRTINDASPLKQHYHVISPMDPSFLPFPVIEVQSMQKFNKILDCDLMTTTYPPQQILSLKRTSNQARGLRPVHTRMHARRTRR